MTIQTIGAPRTGNALLRAFAPADFEALRPALEHAPMAKDLSVFRPGEPAPYVWFPETGMISIVAMDKRGAAIELATVGRDGMSGISLVLGSETMVYAAMVQLPGEGWRIEAAAFRRALEQRPALRGLLLRYVLAVMTQMGQSAACAQLHAAEARCARWLLLAHDEADGDSFPLTQDYLAMMLGLTRPSVSTVASALQKAGLIRYVRGRIEVRDRAGLEAQACECYGVVRRETARLLAPAPDRRG